MKLLAMFLSFFLFASTSAVAQDWAKPRLNKSRRHMEWVTVKAGKRSVKCFIAFPEVKTKATAVLLVHEIFGLSDWARGMTDELAEKGFIAIAPDLLSGTGTGGGGGTETYGSEDAIRQAISKLPPEQITADLNAVADYVRKLPASNGKLAVAGFCWGGGQAFRFATNNKNVGAAFVFYGSPPEAADTARIKVPIYGFYGENDARINATIDQTAVQMKKLGKVYKPVIYKGAGHGFMRGGEAPDAQSGDKTARASAWSRWVELLRGMSSQVRP